VSGSIVGAGRQIIIAYCCRTLADRTIDLPK
jgi:hypothetical protein